MSTPPIHRSPKGPIPPADPPDPPLIQLIDTENDKDLDQCDARTKKAFQDFIRHLRGVPR